MLTPKKHLNLDVSVMRVATIILRELNRSGTIEPGTVQGAPRNTGGDRRSRGVVELEKLRRVVIKRVGADGDLSFMPALSFLYLLGRLEYHLKNDTIEYRAG
jgi:hypothetical protein